MTVAEHPVTPSPSLLLWVGWRTLRDVLIYCLVAICIVIPVRLFVAQPFIVSGTSMEPTFRANEYLVIDRVTYTREAPERGDVVVFQYPLDPDSYFIKRIIGMPGETVAIKDGQVTVSSHDGKISQVLTEPYVAIGVKKEETVVTALAKDEYFVLGDNRSQSSDSRTWGPLARKFIVGRPVVRLWPLTGLQLMPGVYPLHTTLDTIHR